MGMRFYTKQELRGRGLTLCIPYGELTTDETVSILLTTTNSHPYEGKAFKINVADEVESEMVQQKAIDLGYDWPEGKKQIVYTNKPHCIFQVNISPNQAISTILRATQTPN